MTIATKNGLAIIKSNAIARNCACCGPPSLCIDLTAVTRATVVISNATDALLQYQVDVYEDAQAFFGGSVNYRIRRSAATRTSQFNGTYIFDNFENITSGVQPAIRQSIPISFPANCTAQDFPFPYLTPLGVTLVLRQDGTWNIFGSPAFTLTRGGRFDSQREIFPDQPDGAQYFAAEDITCDNFSGGGTVFPFPTSFSFNSVCPATDVYPKEFDIELPCPSTTPLGGDSEQNPLVRVISALQFSGGMEQFGTGFCIGAGEISRYRSRVRLDSLTFEFE